MASLAWVNYHRARQGERLLLHAEAHLDQQLAKALAPEAL